MRTSELSETTKTKSFLLRDGWMSLMSSLWFSVVRRHPVFLGRPHRTWLRQEPLHIQRILQVNRTLYIGARYSGEGWRDGGMVGVSLFEPTYSCSSAAVCETLYLLVKVPQKSMAFPVCSLV